MTWTVSFTHAERQLRKLDRQIIERIAAFLDEKIIGTDDPRRIGQALKGDLRGRWKYRVGDYRLIREFHDKQLVVAVVKLGHRKDIYE